MNEFIFSVADDDGIVLSYDFRSIEESNDVIEVGILLFCGCGVFDEDDAASIFAAGANDGIDGIPGDLFAFESKEVDSEDVKRLHRPDSKPSIFIGTGEILRAW